MADDLVEETNAPTSGTFAVMEGFGNLGALKQIGLMVGLAFSVAFGFGIILWSQEADYRPFFTDISHLEAGQVADLLQKEKIKFKIDTNSNMLMVEASRIHDARLLLAAEGFPSGNTLGYELLDKEQSFGTSQFMEKARYYRSIEGELARTVSSMNRVRAARVHLAIPKRSVFVGDQRKPTASVFLELYPGHALEKMNVAAIVHLVASSVPQLHEGDVTVVDQRGELLSSDDKNSDIALAAKNFEYARNVERLYVDRINGILEPILGFEKFKVQVTTDIDFSVTEQTAELFNPDLPAMRSEQTLSEFSGAGAAAGIPGALSNQPPGAATVPEQAGAGAAGESTGADGNLRRQATRNFELDRTISHTKNQVGKLRRLSVAVVIDDKLVTTGEGKDAKQTNQPLLDSEVERIQVLVKDAIGYSASRGDSVSIVNQAFAPVIESAREDIPPIEWYREAWVMDWAKLGVAILAVIFLIFGLLRPILKGLASTKQDEALMALEGGMGGDLGLGGMGEGMEGGDVMLTGDSNPLLPGPDASYDQHLDAVKSLVAEDPRRVAQVMRTWLADE
ncbi:flagellar M-ring protein FliF [Gammaproteobacteria bacterium 45_16_T64]|nr:flagellar M-ring protein FliF [Gammaproteobacteria bacterium 45_16_T64]